MYETLLHLLQASSVTHNPKITDLKLYGRNAFRVKIQATVTQTITFQVWLNHTPRHTRYAYQLFSSDKALLRWDNAPHHPGVVTNFPHHFHDDQKRVVSSPLQGEPLQDIPIVLVKIERYIASRE